ncbi:D-glucuronyl C5-epimerase family protein [Ornithinimicrobium sp. LYQ92]|uniref:D-glucuronyl C5-epimerase family protein n=1 Tax=Serinicoccus sp. LYQ92 TaxID=3378798 RepID=UPI0038533FBC
MPSARVRRRRAAAVLTAGTLTALVVGWALPGGDPDTAPGQAASSVSASPEAALVPRADLPMPAQVRATRGPDPASTTTRTPLLVDRPRERIEGFGLSDRRMHGIPPGFRPYQSGEVVEVPYGRVDEEGVRQFRITWGSEEVYDHPISQAQYALTALESYRLSGDPAYLDVAVANAERIVEGHETIDGAWYFPYDFDFDLHRHDGGAGALEAPWVSGMATGQALSVFARLHEVTGEQRWQEAAEGAFAAFLQAPDGEGMFVSFVDDDGHLWLEEYPRYPEMASERVLNGQMWAMFGLWDFWMMHDRDHEDAEWLWRGALHTLERTAMPTFREPGGYSRYSVWLHGQAPTYHRYHQTQFLQLHRMSRDPVWVERAALLRADHPHHNTPDGTARLTPDAWSAYRVDDQAPHPSDRTMQILETRPLGLEQTVDVAFDRRSRVPDGPVVLRLAEGEHEGWWVPEEPGNAYALDPVAEHTYEPAVLLGVREELAVEAFRPDGDGGLEVRTVTLRPGDALASDRSAVVHGATAWHVDLREDGDWWIAERPEVLLLDRAGENSG